MRWIITPVAAAAAIMLTACGGGTTTTVTTTITASPQATQPKTSTAPTTIPADRSGNEPVVLHKQVGEKAGVGCPEDPSAPCDVELAITAIQPEAQCDLDSTQLKADEQLLRFDIEVWTAPQFNYSETSSALFLSNWGIGDAQGVDTNLESHTAIRCGGELTGDQISKLLLPGAHMRKSIYVTAPRGATVLRLYDGSRGDGWTWDIPVPAG